MGMHWPTRYRNNSRARVADVRRDVGLVTQSTATTIVLASSSTTRKSLLTNAGIDFDTMAPQVDEDEIRQAMLADGADGDALADALSEHKARYVSRHRPTHLVIGADQILECDGKIFNKPIDRQAARDQLVALGGRDHFLISCVCVVRGGARFWHHLDRARLSMRTLSASFIEDYLDAVGNAAFDGPGSYRIEGIGAQLFARITGDYFTILGLPLIPLLDYLRVQGALRS